MDLVEQKASYLGLQVFRHRNFPKEGMWSRFLVLPPVHRHTCVLLRVTKVGSAGKTHDVHQTLQLSFSLSRARDH